MSKDDRKELLEIYKLHAGLADSVSRQRGVTNRFYLLLMSGLSVLFSALLQFRNGVPLGVPMVSFGLLVLQPHLGWLR